MDILNEKSIHREIFKKQLSYDPDKKYKSNREGKNYKPK